MTIAFAEEELKFREYVKSLDPKIFGLDRLDDVNLEPFTTGHQNVNYLLTLNNNLKFKFALRYNPYSFDKYENTFEEYKKLTDLDGFYAPKVIFFEKPDFLGKNVLVLEFIEGVHKDFSGLSDKEVVMFASAVADINSRVKDKFSESPGAPPKSSGTYLDYLNAMIKNTIDARFDSADPSIYEEDADFINSAREQLKRLIKDNKEKFSENVFSMMHLDLVPPNVIWHDDEITFIDWVSLSYGDRAEEIAYIFAINDLEKDFQKRFLKEYLNHATDTTLIDRIDVYFLKLRIFDLAWSITMLDNESRGNTLHENSTYKSFYNIRLKALKKCLSDLV